MPISLLLYLIQWGKVSFILTYLRVRRVLKRYNAKSQADASGEAIVSLIADNQDNNVRPYTDVLADSQYDDEVNEPISNIIIIRDSP